MARRLILLLAATGFFSGAAGAQVVPSSADTITRVLDRIFDPWRGTDGPGCAVGVSLRGHPVYTRAYGMANLETGTPIRPSSRFMLASVSKQFTAMAILLLARDGRLALDDGIRKYLPEVPAYGTPVTIRHLLTHTSGVRDPVELIYLARGRTEDKVNGEDALDIMSRQKALNSPPGAEYHYNNGAYILLGLIVERVAGKSLREFSDERIFTPLGMMSTAVQDEVDGPLVPERATGYAGTAGAWTLAAIYMNPPGAATVFSTVDDLLKWQANFDSPVVGDRALLNAMQTSALLINGDSTRYGLGLELTRYRGARVIEHSGVESGYRSHSARFPYHGLAIAIVCNTGSANPRSLARRLADSYIGASLAPVLIAAAPNEVTLPAAVLQSRVGAYIQPTTQQLMELSVRDGRLVVNGSIALTALSADRFLDPNREIVFGASEHSGFEVRPRNGRRPIPFVWMQPLSSALAGYSGQYCSEELNTCVQVAAQDSVLTFRNGARAAIARPVFTDGFTWRYSLVQFHRNGATVTGFEVSTAQVRHVQFVRSPVRR